MPGGGPGLRAQPHSGGRREGRSGPGFDVAKDRSVLDLICSHEPVRANGTTPFTTRLDLDDIEFWAVSVGSKYRF